MPHVRSPLKRAERYQRALARGFIAAKPKGFSYIMAPSCISRQARTVVQALALHHAIDSEFEGEHHHLAHAALEFRELMSSSDFEHAMQLNKAAGRAKHNISVNCLRRPERDACCGVGGGAAPAELEWTDTCPDAAVRPLVTEFPGD